MEENFKQKLNHIRCFIFDLDGVLTNGDLVITPDGEFLRSMNIKDGYALQLAVKKGYHIALISGGRSEGVPKRMTRLGITEVHLAVENKMEVFKTVVEKYKLELKEILYMGDDMPDLKVMKIYYTNKLTGLGQTYLILRKYRKKMLYLVEQLKTWKIMKRN